MSEPNSTAQKRRKLSPSEFFGVLSEVTTNSLHVPVIFVRVCDRSIADAALLQQIMYWRRKMGREFYKRHGYDGGDGWQAELGLDANQTRRSTRSLEARGFVTTRVGHGRDNKRATFYDVDTTALVEALLDLGVEEFEYATIEATE